MITIAFYDFRIKTMFGSSLPPVVCRRAHVLFTLFVFVQLRTVVSNTYCVVFLFSFSSSCVPYVASFQIDCPFLTAPQVFSNIYFYITASTDDLTLILGMSLCGVGLFAILVIVLFICCKKRSKKKVYLFNVKYDQGFIVVFLNIFILHWFYFSSQIALIG